MTSSLGSEPTIHAEAVSVRYRLPSYGGSSVKEYLIERFRGRLSGAHPFQALADVTFEVGRGESFGVIGANGAGKSTLLRICAGILPPTSGRVRVRGHVRPILDLAPGFHPELTGRENVFLNGTMLGYRRAELSERYDEIVQFADLGEFLSAPLRAYSDGMRMRLAFAVATCIRPDVLILDEILAVGDEGYRRKCFARIEEFRSKGTTILLVSHSLDELSKSCERALWLDHGRVRALGPVSQVAEEYLHAVRRTA